ncbi:tRNA (adenosine(37)-N6)-threonylcarbamoyltransferase complex dimerization subunit type 1 TsaB [Cutibacterium acnes]|uniref:tRNA (adenosine(37)-N6)-threonylcarbamoyltransferase complex dimerization subunit type 1 TsaB n=1 Tax=Cutibacterium acnes TaxID=1747 RepID=UPI000C1E28FD|nr:tRNA (adenosine(37)-N6)-threonylcarbamoyltransferase complex dimerization subunit type 1 TsaB [Cutibacterium acnes]PIS94388.1 tRNA (adenosine(37)-N6)-threonylcarbamoyltransferase complex dimerization subunit type 1 TsaB [Cutibacterium acnes]
MNIIVLGIDTSTAVSVGLARGSEVLVSLHYDDPRAHAEQLMPLIHRGCEEAGIALTDIAGVAIGVGPGPYTGLRVGVATGRVLAHLAGLTPHPVCSLDILARQWAGVDGEFVVCTDARRHELYWARYDASGHRLDGPNVTRPEDLPKDLPIGGPGCLVRGLTPTPGSPEHLDAGVLAASWQAMPDVGLEPLYLRDPDATVPTTRKATLTPTRLTLPGR